MNEDFALSDLTLLEKMQGFTFGDLSVAQQRKLQTRALRIVVLEDGTSEAIRQELFHRINTQSVRARGSEVRRGAFQGPFVDFIKECAENPLFRQLCPISPSLLKRREDEELVTRFFCYSDRYKSFKHDVDKFVDEFVSENRDAFDEVRYRQEFEGMLQFVERYFPYGFAKAKSATSTPRVRFEAIAVGVNLARRERAGLIPGRLPSSWIGSAEFTAQTTTHASNSGPRLRGRIEFVRDKLLEV